MYFTTLRDNFVFLKNMFSSSPLQLYSQTSVHWSDTVHLLGLRQPVDLHQDETELPLFSAQQVQLTVILTDFKVQGDFYRTRVRSLVMLVSNSLTLV